MPIDLCLQIAVRYYGEDVHVHTHRHPPPTLPPHVWEQKCMGLHAQKIMVKREPERTLMRTHTPKHTS